MLEAVPRASADQPDIFAIGMPIDQKIAVRGVLILTDARFDQRGSGEIGKSLAQDGSGFTQRCLRDFTRAGFRIERRSVRVESDLETASIKRGNRINALAKCYP